MSGRILETESAHVIQDLKKVLDAGTYKLAAEWEQLGLALGIERFRLRQLKTNNHGDTTACLTDALQIWIDTGSATLEKLGDAVSNPAFINNENLSKEIKEEYMKQLSRIPTTTDEATESSNSLLEDSSNKFFELAMECVHQNEDLAVLMMDLKEKFRILLVDVQRSLLKPENELNIDILKNDFRSLLQDNQSITPPSLREISIQIEKIQSIGDLFKFLLDHKYISYINYGILCDYGASLHNQEIRSMVKKYEESYNTIFEKPAFADLIEVFKEHQELRPTEVIGLPRIFVKIALDAHKISFEKWNRNSWGPYVKLKRTMIENVSRSSIVLTYAIFPADLTMVVNNLQSSQAEKYFFRMGVSVTIPKATQDIIKLFSKEMGATIEIPQDTQKSLQLLKIPYPSSLSTDAYNSPLRTHHKGVFSMRQRTIQREIACSAISGKTEVTFPVQSWAKEHPWIRNIIILFAVVLCGVVIYKRYLDN